MKKAKRKSKTAKSFTVKKYPFDPDNDEKHELTPDEISRLEPGSGGKAEAWTNPSQYDYDKLRERLIACGIKTDSLKSYSITDAVRALREGYPKSIKQVYEIEHAEASDKWEDRYASVVTASNRLRHWHEREKNIINRLFQANNENLKQGQKPSAEDARTWLSEIWPFGEHCERLYKVPDDLDAIYLAVGLRLDKLFRARNLVAEEMIEVIISEWRYADELRYDKESVLLCFGPCFNGNYMAYDDPLELFWRYIEADLQAHGFDPKHTGNSVMPMDLRGSGNCPNRRLLIKLNNSPEGIEGNKKIHKRLVEYVRDRRKRPDIAKTITLDKDGLIQTTLRFGTMIKEK